MRSEGVDSRDDRDDEELRAALRDWPAPSPPPEIEDDLRRTFRQRRRARGRRPLVWLSLAAGIVLVALFHRERAAPAVAPVRSAASTSVVPPTTAPSAAPEPGAAPKAGRPEVTPRAPRLVEAARALPPPRRVSVHRVAVEEAVVVESDQAVLLADLGRRLRGGISPGAGGPIPAVEALPEDGDGVTVRPMPKTDLPAYRARWETRADEWPRVERSTGGR